MADPSARKEDVTELDERAARHVRALLEILGENAERDAPANARDGDGERTGERYDAVYLSHWRGGRDPKLQSCKK